MIYLELGFGPASQSCLETSCSLLPDFFFIFQLAMLRISSLISEPEPHPFTLGWLSCRQTSDLDGLPLVAALKGRDDRVEVEEGAVWGDKPSSLIILGESPPLSG